MPGLVLTTVALDTCNRASGAVQVSISDGEAPFEVTFGEGAYATLDAGGVTVTDLSAGVYAVRVVDANGCSSAPYVRGRGARGAGYHGRRDHRPDLRRFHRWHYRHR